MTREEATRRIECCRNFLANNYSDMGESNFTAFNMAIEALEQQPKTGHWIKVTNGRGGHECNICHEYAPSYRSGDEYLTKYCPNCGAKMVEPQSN